MAKKKTQPPRKKKKTNSNKKSIPKELKKIVFGIIILVFIVITAAVVADLFLDKKDRPGRDIDQTEEKAPAEKKETKPEQPEAAPETPPEKSKETPPKKVRYEVFEEGKIVPDPGKVETGLEKPAAATDRKRGTLPRIAIIIDDIGYDRKNAEALAMLDHNLTFSILPGSPYGKEIAKTLHHQGFPLMLHLPMEPVEYPEVDPGSNALLSIMSPDELISQLRRNLDEIPNIEGVNNHMGSRLTTLSEKMNQIFSILKKRDLFFIDSITASDSMCASSAKLLKVNFARRDVFIDNIQDAGYINGQLEQLMEIAEKNGEAIGIAHPYSATVDTLKESLPRIKKRVDIVPASKLTRISG